MKKFTTLRLFLFCLAIGSMIYIISGNNSLYSNSESIKVDLFIKNHLFSPEILELPAGKKIHITVHNQDDTIEEFESIDLKREKIIIGKSKAVIILAPLKPGEYKFFGDFHPETAQGKIITTERD